MRVAAVAALLVSIAALVACGDEGDTNSPPQTIEPRESQARRAPATEQEQRARTRETARARRRAAARRPVEARARRRQVRAQQRALDRSRGPENAPGDDCAEGYDPCVPPYPPDVDCAELSGPYRVTPPDPHKLDPDGDGKAC
jgi:hypothetical protein